MNSTDLVFSTPKGNPATNSVLVAAKFNKKHGNVLRAIEDLLTQLSDNEFKINFALKYRTIEFGVPILGVRPTRQEPYYILSQDAFTLLVMGFTGKKAMQFKLDYISAFNQMRGRLQGQQQTVTTVQATEEVARLAQYTSIPKQIECVKQIASTLMRNGKAPFTVINHHRQVMKALTGMRPSEYVEAAVKQQQKVKGQSGRAVLRKLEPEKAATAAVMDDAVRQGKSLQDMENAGIVIALPRAFQAILQLGLIPADLQADKAA